MTVQVKEITYDTYKDLNDIFKGNEAIITELRNKYKGNCVRAAQALCKILQSNGILAEYVTFKNGHAFINKGVKVFNNTYTHHCVVLLGDSIIDILHSDKIFQTEEYIEELLKDNPNLRIDYTLSTCWYDKNGYPCRL